MNFHKDRLDMAIVLLTAGNGRELLGRQGATVEQQLWRSGDFPASALSGL
jgi:hypothetical protein